MGRGRVEMKLIENKINRQVTFSKRRCGLMKKARELSVLCDAEVALIVFSSRGKLFDFASSSGGLNKTIERYQNFKQNLSPQRQICTTASRHGSETHLQSCPHRDEFLTLKAMYESLQRTQRILLGEDLGPLDFKDLENLEKQLESALARARQRKAEIWMKQIDELQRKERHLMDDNKQLKTKVPEELSLQLGGGGAGGSLFFPWNDNATSDDNNTKNNQSTPCLSFYHLLQPSHSDHGPQPFLQIGYDHYMGAEVGSSGARDIESECNVYHGWDFSPF